MTETWRPFEGGVEKSLNPACGTQKSQNANCTAVEYHVRRQPVLEPIPTFIPSQNKPVARQILVSR